MLIKGVQAEHLCFRRSPRRVRCLGVAYDGHYRAASVGLRLEPTAKSTLTTEKTSMKSFIALVSTLVWPHPTNTKGVPLAQYPSQPKGPKCVRGV